MFEVHHATTPSFYLEPKQLGLGVGFPVGSTYLRIRLSGAVPAIRDFHKQIYSRGHIPQLLGVVTISIQTVE